MAGSPRGRALTVLGVRVILQGGIQAQHPGPSPHGPPLHGGSRGGPPCPNHLPRVLAWNGPACGRSGDGGAPRGDGVTGAPGRVTEGCGLSHPSSLASVGLWLFPIVAQVASTLSQSLVPKSPPNHRQVGWPGHRGPHRRTGPCTRPPLPRASPFASQPHCVPAGTFLAHDGISQHDTDPVGS